MDDGVYYIIVIAVAIVAATIGLLHITEADSKIPTYIQYYDYPYGDNHSLIRLPVLTCYNAYWWDIRNSFERNKYISSPDFFYNGSNGFCHKEWH